MEKQRDIILTEGEWTNEQLANFFGITSRSFKNVRAKKLKILQDYAEFEILRGKINITKVIEAVPYCSKRKQIENIVKELLLKLWAKNGFDTISNVVDLAKDDPRLKDVNYNTLYYYMRKIHLELFGSPKKRNGGTKGLCYFKWGKRSLERFKQPEYFTPEEEEYFNYLISKAYDRSPEEEAEIEAIYRTYKETDEEYKEFQKEQKEKHRFLWQTVVEEGMQEKYNILLICGTQDEWNAWVKKEKEE